MHYVWEPADHNGRSFTGIAVSNTATDWMSVCLLLSVAFCQVQVSTSADHSSRGVLLSVVCLSVIVTPGQWETTRSLTKQIFQESLWEITPLKSRPEHRLSLRSFRHILFPSRQVSGQSFQIHYSLSSNFSTQHSRLTDSTIQLTTKCIITVNYLC